MITAILKWIPVEVLAAYEFALGFIPNADAGLWLTVILVPMTGLWIAFATRDWKKKQPPIAWRQVILSSIAFIFWSVGTQPEIVKTVISMWETWMGSVTLAVGGLLLPIGEGVLYLLGVGQSDQT
jgi:hypothetical protein